MMMLEFRFSSGSGNVCTRRISIVQGTKVVIHNNRNPTLAYTYTSTWKSKTQNMMMIMREKNKIDAVLSNLFILARKLVRIIEVVVFAVVFVLCFFYLIFFTRQAILKWIFRKFNRCTDHFIKSIKFTNSMWMLWNWKIALESFKILAWIIFGLDWISKAYHVHRLFCSKATMCSTWFMKNRPGQKSKLIHILNWVVILLVIKKKNVWNEIKNNICNR